MPTIRELEKMVQSIRMSRRGDLRKNELALIVAWVQSGNYLRAINRRIMQLNTQLALIIDTAEEENRPPRAAQMNPLIRDLRRQIPTLFRNALEQLASQVVGMNSDTLDVELTSARLRALTGLPVDSFGRFKPQPATVPNIENESLEFDEILERISPLIVINGDTTLRDAQTETPSEMIRGRDELAALELAKPTDWDQLRDEDLKRQTGRPWSERLRIAMTAALGGLAGAAITQYRRRNAIAAKRLIRNKLGIRTEQQPGALDTPATASGGLLRNVELIARQEATRVSESDRDRTITEIDLIVGYELNSVFAANTAPDHAARDGWLFFKDDRASANLPWSQRIIPPYRINCLCWRREIWEDPDGQEHFAEWEVTPRFRGAQTATRDDVGQTVWDANAGGFHRIQPGDVGRRFGRPNAAALQPRDVRSYAEWFNEQRPGIQRTILTDRPFFAALAKQTRGRVQYQDVVLANGRLMTAREIDSESGSDTRVRTSLVRQLIRRQSRQHKEAFTQGFGKFDLTGQSEAEYLSRLRLFLQRAKGNR